MSEGLTYRLWKKTVLVSMFTCLISNKYCFLFICMCKDATPKELLDHLAAVKSIQVTLPDEPDGRCSNSLQV